MLHPSARKSIESRIRLRFGKFISETWQTELTEGFDEIEELSFSTIHHWDYVGSEKCVKILSGGEKTKVSKLKGASENYVTLWVMVK